MLTKMKEFIRRAKGAVVGNSLPPPPVRARHAEWSVISSVDDLRPGPTDDLFDLLLDAAALARSVELPDLEARSGSDDARFVATWPGEHYRLLPALVAASGALSVVEIGTFRGHGALALRSGLPSGQGRVLTYDIVAWTEIPDAVLRADDDRIEQRLGDLASASYREDQLADLRQADLVFVDGPKDGRFEDAIVFEVLPLLTQRCFVVWDDIRVMNMVDLWRRIPYPKLDATSFGHWSGTGLVLVNP